MMIHEIEENKDNERFKNYFKEKKVRVQPAILRGLNDNTFKYVYKVLILNALNQG